MAALRLFARFLDWAGVGWPEGREWPDRPGEPARVDLALPEEDYERLLRAIPTFPFLGETGLDYRETVASGGRTTGGRASWCGGGGPGRCPSPPRPGRPGRRGFPSGTTWPASAPSPTPTSSSGPRRSRWSLGALVPRHAGLDQEAKGLPRRLPKGGGGEELPVEPREEALPVRAGVEDH